MTKLKKIMIATVVIVCGIAVVVLSYLKFAASGLYGEYVGEWTVADEDGQLFCGSVRGVELNTKPGSLAKTMLIFYDTARFGYLCSQISESQQKICFTVKVNKDEIQKDDRVDLVVESVAGDIPPFVALLERSGDTLEIKGAPLTDTKCAKNHDCEYIHLSTLKRK